MTEHGTSGLRHRRCTEMCSVSSPWDFHKNSTHCCVFLSVLTPMPLHPLSAPPGQTSDFRRSTQRWQPVKDTSFILKYVFQRDLWWRSISLPQNAIGNEQFVKHNSRTVKWGEKEYRKSGWYSESCMFTILLIVSLFIKNPIRICRCRAWLIAFANCSLSMMNHWRGAIFRQVITALVLCRAVGVAGVRASLQIHHYIIIIRKGWIRRKKNHYD